MTPQDVEVTVDWSNSHTAVLQIDGHDLVTVDLDADGSGCVVVWASTAPEAEAAAFVDVRWDER